MQTKFPSESILDVALQLGAKLRRIGREHIGGCPRCGGRDRFSVNPARGLWNCRGCDKGGDVVDLVQHIRDVGFVEAKRILGIGSAAITAPEVRRPAPPIEPGNYDERAAASAARIIGGMVPIAGTLGERFLREERKIDTDAIADVLNRTDAIGWNPAVFYNNPGHHLHGQHLGAIIGVMTDVKTAAPTGAISRTYISADGKKVGKAKTLGSPPGIVRLSWDDDVTLGLMLAEGIETALAAMAIGLRPMWSTGSTGIMAKFPILSGIEAITIFADHDENGSGLKAATECATAWRNAGKEVRVFMWEQIGDFNDALRGRYDEP